MSSTLTAQIDTIQAMIRAHERSSHYADLLQRVRGVVFMGVPHRGSDVAYWAAFAANILQFGQLGFATNPAYVTALRRNSETFAAISTQFVERAVPLSIRTFFETERMGNQLVRYLLRSALSANAESTPDCR
jgi:hypothetical protein